MGGTYWSRNLGQLEFKAFLRRHPEQFPLEVGLYSV